MLRRDEINGETLADLTTILAVADVGPKINDDMLPKNCYGMKTQWLWRMNVSIDI
jgi:hypothetical protein